jgi:hypothetical protein
MADRRGLSYEVHGYLCSHEGYLPRLLRGFDWMHTEGKEEGSRVQAWYKSSQSAILQMIFGKLSMSRMKLEREEVEMRSTSELCQDSIRICHIL